MFRPAFVALLIAAALAPATAQSSTSFGLGVGFSYAGGDMTQDVGHDSAFGYGLRIRFGFDGGHAFMPRLDRVAFTGMEDDPNGVVAHPKDTLTMAGVDYNWFTARKAEGFYLATGIGMLRKEEAGSVYTTYYATGSTTKTHPYFALGLGGVVDGHVDLSARLLFFGDERHVHVEGGAPSAYETRKANSAVFTLGLAYHF